MLAQHGEVHRKIVRRSRQCPPRFQVGLPVRARNINPIGHTRLPRYARGRNGVITRNQGVFAFEDSNEDAFSRFSTGELWGENARPSDTVYFDLWESHLEHT
jgi:hypothetical protein